MNILKSKKRSLIAMDYLNLLLMNIHLGVRPYLVVYLSTALSWNPLQIGMIMSISGLVGVLAQTPVGGLIDISKYKRLLIIVGALIIGICSLITVLVNDFIVICATQSMASIAGTVFAPAVAAISLGIVGRKNIDKQIGRNQTFTAVGNVLAAIAIGLCSYFWGTMWIYYTIVLMSLLVVVTVFFIKEKDIDHQLARGADHERDEQAVTSNIWELITKRSTIIFIVSVILFHSANAAMLPMLGQLLSAEEPRYASAYLSACIIVAQLVMIPLGVHIGALASIMNRRPLMLIAFLILPIRGLLYTVSGNPFFLISIQVLDGIAASITGVMQIMIAADITRGTGRLNFMQGLTATALGFGTALSNLLSGYLIKYEGFNIGFISLAFLALAALGFFYFAMPETKEQEREARLVNKL